MIDIRFLRENPDAVRENIKKKFQDSKLPLVDEVLALDVESRSRQSSCFKKQVLKADRCFNGSGQKRRSRRDEEARK